MCELHQRWKTLWNRIDHAVAQCGRAKGSVRLLAVSKFQSTDAIRALYELGQRDFGENYVQEALQKQAKLCDLKDLNWHFIGPVQRNKTLAIATHFDWVHSVDRFLIAQRLSEQRPEKLTPLQICLQVNVDAEDSKSGCKPDEVQSLVEAIMPLPAISLRGFMSIPAPGHIQTFSVLSSLIQQWPSMDTLSMGMSDDLEDAIRAGSTWVRVGTALFGKRAH